MQENISPSVIRKVAGELRKLMETPIDGVKIIPNETDITDIQAIIEGPSKATPSQFFFLCTQNLS
jgi:ubiquitin-conjugating enzyme E2 S